MVQENLKYTNDHEWIRIEDDIAVVGITDFAQGELGDIVYVEIETIDQNVKMGDVFGTVEAVKTVSDLFMPISGDVIELNEKLESEPELVNNDPYGDGWMVKIKFENKSELDSLLDAQGYEINASEIKLSAANSITMMAPAEYHFINTLEGIIPKAKTGIFSTVGGPVDYVLIPAISGDPIPRFSINTVGPFLVNCAAGGALFTVAAGVFSVNVAAGACTLAASAACSITAGAAVNITAVAACKISAATILLN